MILCIRLSSLVTSSQWNLSPRSPQGHMTAILLARPQLDFPVDSPSPLSLSLSSFLSLSLSLSITPTRTLCLMYDITWSRDNGGQRDKWLSPRGVRGSFVQSTLCSLSFTSLYKQLKKGQKSVQCEQLTLCAWPLSHLHKGFNKNN